MGLFDTVHFAQPIEVPGWKEPVAETQTKFFGNMMQDYTVGSLLPESPVLTGVVEDFLWCPPENQGDEGRTHPVYFAIWHRIFAGAYLDAAEAGERLRTVDRLDLIAWLDEAQRGKRRWMSRYRQLFADVKAWHRHQTEPEPQDESERTAISRLWLKRLPDEILQAPDPLANILATHLEKEQKPDRGEPDWFA